MAKKKPDRTKTKQSPGFSDKEHQLLIDVLEHYDDWTNDNETRMHRKNGWNDVTNAYWGELPSDWPYESRVVDPRIRTTIIEKNARLLNSKLRGRFVPRKGSSVLGASLNNAIIDFQWDTANYGGTMQSKLSVADQDTRLYGSKFAYNYWRHYERDGEVRFDGNELKVLDIRDCGMDPAATHIRDAKWFQMREWKFLEDIEDFNKNASDGSKFRNLSELKLRMKDKNYAVSDRRDTEYESRIKQLKGLEDRVGQDKSFPIVELVHEFRDNKWITFMPRYSMLSRVIKNPFNHGKIPINQLRYYQIQDDNLGESEVEPVLGLWKAIQAVVCGYLDEMNLKMQPPIKILDGAARIETIVYGPSAQWIVDRQDAVQEVQSSGEAQRWFQTTYSALVSAYNSAMGELSQGVSGLDPFNPDKTATEVRQTARQQNARDERNQTDLNEFIKDIIMMWQSNNKQFLFSDTNKREYVLSIVGSEAFEFFKRAGLDEMEVPDESMEQISEIISMQDGNVSDADISEMLEAAKVPKHPVEESSDDGVTLMKPKMRISDTGESADVSIVPEDLDGYYDYVPDVKSMALGSNQELLQARQRAIELFTANDKILMQLQEEGFRPKIKELLSATLEDLGLRDAERFFEQYSEAGTQEAPNALGGATPALPAGGLPGALPTNPQAISQQPQSPGSLPIQNPGGVFAGLQ